MGMAANGLRPPSAGLQRNQWCTFPFLPQQRFSYEMQGKPLEYAQLVLSSEMAYYLFLGCNHGRLED